MLATASLELKAEKQSAHAQQYGQSIKAVQFSPDGLTIVSCGFDKTIKVWEVQQALPVPADADLPELKRLAIARGYTLAEFKRKSGDELLILLSKGATLLISNRDEQSLGCRCVGTGIPDP